MWALPPTRTRPRTALLAPREIHTPRVRALRLRGITHPVPGQHCSGRRWCARITSMTGDEMPDTEQAAQPGQLSIEAATTDGIRLLPLAGEIDNDTGGTLRQALDVSTTQQPRLVVDLGQVTFMD